MILPWEQTPEHRIANAPLRFDTFLVNADEFRLSVGMNECFAELEET